MPSPERKPKNTRANREFDPSRYSFRHIALKFAYLGQRYNGLEFHPNNKTPLPTVEEELWKALNKARLVSPTPNPLLDPGEPNWEGCEYSKCGRTDKGVSAFGQVIGIRVRSNRPVHHAARTHDLEEDGGKEDGPLSSTEVGHVAPTNDPTSTSGENSPPTPPSAKAPLSDDSDDFHSINDEIPYCQVLNRILPPDIRMLAWCPDPPPDFSARFSCKERRYRYFFTQPAFSPTVGFSTSRDSHSPTPPSGARRGGWLDISAMRVAARKYTGLHDFRNFCKLDPSKQIENFNRRIFHADIECLDPQRNPPGYVSKQNFSEFPGSGEGSTSGQNAGAEAKYTTPTIYSFTLHGSAFLWHQVRHMVAVLFLIGQGLEAPSLIEKLLDVQKMPCKPQYEMADDAPLVLWDCLFPSENQPDKADALNWIYVGDYTGEESGVNKAGGRRLDGKYSMPGLVDDMWRVWRGRKIDEILAGTLLDVIVAQGDQGSRDKKDRREDLKARTCHRSQKVFQGGNGPRTAGRYIPVMEKSRLESVEAINAKYAKRKGFEESEEVKGQGFRRVAIDRGDATTTSG